MRYSDAHLHLTKRMRSILERDTIPCVISCSNPNEYAQANAFAAAHPAIHISCGIHPWHVSHDAWEHMLPCLEKAAVIGEIGMDSVWCSSDRKLQKILFEQQLAYASSHHKPVVLHTKGMEKEILELIRQYPNRYHVHWYSCSMYLEEYIAQDCYFSVGPFPSLDPAVASVARQVPENRLLIESDGIAAIEWATGKALQDDGYLLSLRRIAEEIADLRKKNTEAILHLTQQNLQSFLQQPL